MDVGIIEETHLLFLGCLFHLIFLLWMFQPAQFNIVCQSNLAQLYFYLQREENVALKPLWLDF